MEFRPGTCSACKASFRIPATFTANKAKCSKCGGVVEIGPITSDSATLTPVSTDPAKATSAPVAAAAARLASKPPNPTGLPMPGGTIPAPSLPVTHPSTEGVQLSVNPEPTQPTPPTPSSPSTPSAKPAVPARPVPAKPPLSTSKPGVPAGRPVPSPGAKPVPSPGAKPVPSPGAKPGQPAAKPFVPVKVAGASKHAPSMPGTAKPAVPMASKSAAKGKASAKHDKDEGPEGESHEERRRRIAKNKGVSPMLLAGAGLLFVAVGIGVYIVYQKQQEKKAVENAEIAAAKEARIQKDKEDQKAREAANKAEEDRIEADRIARGGPPKGEVLAAETEPKPEEKPVEKPAAKPGEPKVVEGYDLSLIPDFPPLAGTTPEEWTELQTLAATFVDPSAGARASRAGLKLEETPKKAFPAILNQFKKLDLTTEDGFRMADATQKTLERICHGHNMGWKYQQEENWLQYDQKAIKKWCDVWAKASVDEAAWNKLIKADANREGEADPSGTPPPPKKIDDF